MNSGNPFLIAPLVFAGPWGLDILCEKLDEEIERAHIAGQNFGVEYAKKDCGCKKCVDELTQ